MIASSAELEPPKPIEITYKAEPTLVKFHACDKRVRIIIGPPGSGKSSGCIIELLARAFRQAPDKYGIRPTRMAIIRDTYPNLRNTTLKTFKAWMPAQYGYVKGNAPYTGEYNIPLPDGTTAKIEYIFLALEGEEEEIRDKLSSFEPTLIYLNELHSLSLPVFTISVERNGRYPATKDVPGGATYHGVIADTNVPPDNHWFWTYKDNLPPNAEIFTQPAPYLIKDYIVQADGSKKPDYTTLELNPARENKSGTKESYYPDMLMTDLAVNNEASIKRNLLMMKIPLNSGLSVFPEFSMEKHVNIKNITPQEYTDTIVGIDTSGIHPAAVFLQPYKNRWICTDVVCGVQMGTRDFIEAIEPMLELRYKGCRLIAFVDPANARSSETATAPSNTLKKAKTEAGNIIFHSVFLAAKSNAFLPRRDAVSYLLNLPEDKCLVISPHCKSLTDALNGGYKYAKTKITGVGQVDVPRPQKGDEHSHPADALQYGALGILRYERKFKSHPVDTDLSRRIAENILNRARALS